MNAAATMRDERTIATENASYRWAYLLISYGLLGSIMYRSFVIHEATWDLMALVIAGGAVASVYQGRQRVLSGRWAVMTAASMAIAAVIALALLLATARQS